MPTAHFSVLVAPLDWGLGHATRCIPIIDQLLRMGAGVYLAGAGRSAALLRQHYPQLPFLELPAYQVRYPGGNALVLHLLRQLPRLFRVISTEKDKIREWQQQFHFQLIISDNRYGVYHSEVPSVFICHQLAPLASPPWRSLQWLIYQLHRRWLRAFSQIWVPDFPDAPGLSGILSHRFRPPLNTHFIGPLSHLSHTAAKSHTLPEAYRLHPPKILIILSGPEPQRSHLEKDILQQWHLISRTIWLVQGKTEKQDYEICNHHRLLSFLDSSTLAWALQQAELVISRPGYSSIMDYAAMEVPKMILIPTPGQTEQIYLAKQLHKAAIALSVPQKNFILSKAIQQLDDFQGFSYSSDAHFLLDKALSPLLSESL